MKTPIYDFVKQTAKKNISRFFMPGHKGRAPYDSVMEAISCYDITEITGADALFDATGIIGQSEQNATALFGSKATIYSTQGSTLAIQTMISLVFRHGGKKILAARNAHHAFLYACDLFRIDISWILPEQADFYGICGAITADQVEQALQQDSQLDAVYITSPDYLGNIVDVAAVSAVCKKYGVPLLCDNAHGAYLKFCGKSVHPLDLGVSLCCDSAHKTLPVLTGGAYLHLSKDSVYTKEEAKEAMGCLASTSPSYLILTSLDLCNRYLEEHASEDYAKLKMRIEILRNKWEKHGICCLKNNVDFSKITIDAGKIGWDGIALQRWLEERNIGCEYANLQYVVLMTTPFLTEKDWKRLDKAMSELVVREGKEYVDRMYRLPLKKMPSYEAILLPRKEIPIEEAESRIAAQAISACPPGVPIIVAGEMVTEQIKNICKNSGKIHIKVLK